MCFAAIMVLAPTKFAIFTYLKGAEELPQGAKLKDYEGKYVHYTVKYPLEVYMEEYQAEHPERVTASSYVTWDENYDDFICVTVSHSKDKDFLPLAEKAWNYLTDETAPEVEEGIEIKGTVVRMSVKEKDYYKQTITELFGSDFIADTNKFYCIHDEEIKGEDVIIVWIMTGVSLIMILIGAFIPCAKVMTAGRKDIKKFLKKHPDVTKDMLEQDFAVAKAFKPGLWIGQRFTFFYIGGMEIVQNKDIVWVYDCGVASSTETRIAFCTIDGNSIILLLTQEDVNQALDLFEYQMPHVLIGYDESLRHTFLTDMPAFLQIKYNQVMPAKL